MAKYVLKNEDSDLASLAKQVEAEMATRNVANQVEKPADGVPVHEMPDEQAVKKALPRSASRRRRSPVPLIVAGAGAMVVILAVVFLVFVGHFFAGQGKKRHSLPDFLGRTGSEAAAELKKQGFSIAIEYVTTSKRPTGTVIATMPAAGTRLQMGEKVVLRIAGKAPKHTDAAMSSNPNTRSSSPQNPAPNPQTTKPNAPNTDPSKTTDIQPQSKNPVIPSIDGVKAEEARETLKSLGLKIVESTATDAQQPDGVVLSVDPKAGTEVKTGDSVRIKVNTRPSDTSSDEKPAQDETLVTVPDCTGLSGQDAVRALRSLGLRTEWQYEENSRYTPGTVVLTNPPAGSRIAPDSQVTLMLAK